jgi:ribosome maturation factor RimP
LDVQVDTLKGITIKECRIINREIDNYLVDNELDWGVEVGSPGLSKEFKVFQQYDKNKGREIEVVTVDGERYKGTLSVVTPNGVALTWERKIREEGSKKKRLKTFNESFSFEADEELKQIKSAKVVISFK